MRRRRARAAKGRRTPIEPVGDDDLCRGPGNLTMAMGITLADNRVDLTGDRLFLQDRGLTAGAHAVGPRIGIRVGTERPWRFWIDGHRAVSARRIGTAASA